MAISQATQPRVLDAAQRRRRRVERIWLPIAFLAPTLILLWTFDIYPLLLGSWISLWRWGIRPQEFIGLDNYKRIIEDMGVSSETGAGEVGQSLLVTFFYSLGTVPIILVLAFVIANMLYSKIRGLAFFRTAFFIPYITSTVAAGLGFTFLFNPQVGVFNAMLNALGLPTQTWLLDASPVVPKALAAVGLDWPEGAPAILGGPSVALVSVMTFTVWHTLGFAVVILLAGLVAINPEVHESARMDGANSWTLATRITLPLVSPTLFFLLIVLTIRSFQSFNDVFVLTSGGGYGAGAGSPLDTTLTLPVLIFRHLYQRPDSVGYAAALSMLLFILLLAVALVQFRVAERKVHYK